MLSVDSHVTVNNSACWGSGVLGVRHDHKLLIIIRGVRRVIVRHVGVRHVGSGMSGQACTQIISGVRRVHKL